MRPQFFLLTIVLTAPSFNIAAILNRKVESEEHLAFNTSLGQRVGSNQNKQVIELQCISIMMGQRILLTPCNRI